MREHPKGPEALSARRATVEAEVIAEVPFATPTMQAVQDSWMGLVTQIIRRLIPPPVIVIAGVLPLMIYCNDLGFRV